jgi:hypothetical protein
LFEGGSTTLWVLPAVLLFRSWQRYVALEKAADFSAAEDFLSGIRAACQSEATH